MPRPDTRPATESETPANPVQVRGSARIALRIGLVALVVGGLAWLAQDQLGLRTMMAAPAAKPTPAPIDGDRAYRYLKQVCDLGPHPAGSPANEKVKALAVAHFKKLGGIVREQNFPATDPRTNAPLPMSNVIASWFPERADRVLICAHYDSRPFPDEDADPANRKKPFLGANDPGSGIALLMEVAHHLNDSPTPWGVDLVLFDGEELVYGNGDEQVGDYFLGSRAFARAYADSDRRKAHYEAGILLDMVGSKDLLIDKEQYSVEFAPKLIADIWAVAKALKVPQFRDRVGRAVYDDHLALNNAGIRAVDLIDFTYKHWHTAQDVPENCSGQSLATVGKVVTAWMNQPKPKGR